MKKLKISNTGIPDLSSPHILSSQTLSSGVLISLRSSPDLDAAFEINPTFDTMGNDGRRKSPKTPKADKNKSENKNKPESRKLKNSDSAGDSQPNNAKTPKPNLPQTPATPWEDTQKTSSEVPGDNNNKLQPNSAEDSKIAMSNPPVLVENPEDVHTSDKENKKTPQPPKPLPATENHLAQTVINHFASRLDTFTQGFSKDVAEILATDSDPEKGLVAKVSNLQDKVNALKNGKDGALPLEDQLTNLTTRLQKVETRDPALTKVPPGSVAVCLATVETACTCSNEGLPLKIVQMGMKITKLRGLINQIATIEDSKVTSIKMDDIAELKTEAFYNQKDLCLVTGFMHRMERKVGDLDHCSNMNKAKLMRNTLIFRGVCSTEEEPALDALKKFLHNIMKIKTKDSDIMFAEFLGSGYTRVIRDKEIQFPAPVRARCTERFANTVMNNATRLGGKKDQEGGSKYYVRRSMPEGHRASWDKHAKEVQRYRIENRKKKLDSEKTTVRFEGSRFFVNGQLVHENIAPPTFRDMLLINSETQCSIDEVVTCSSPHIELKSSWFQAYTTKITCLEDIDIAYMKVQQQKQFADHVMAAYRLKTSNTTVQEGGSCDGEHYGNQEILRLLKMANVVNLAVFAAREYGGVQLGNAHFKIIKEVATKAIQQLEPEVLHLPPSPKPPHPRRTWKKHATGRPQDQMNPKEPQPSGANGGDSSNHDSDGSGSES